MSIIYNVDVQAPLLLLSLCRVTRHLRWLLELFGYINIECMFQSHLHVGYKLCFSLCFIYFLKCTFNLFLVFVHGYLFLWTQLAV